MNRRLHHTLLIAFAATALHAQAEPETEKIAITTEKSVSTAQALSRGFDLERKEFDPEGKAKDEKSRSGIEFSSFKPGTVWSGEVPPFFPETVVIGGEDEFPITDVLSSGEYLFGLYGMDHYKTRVISVTDKNRHNPYEFTAYSLPDIAFCALADGVLYYTTVESNENKKKQARLHAFSISEKKQLWQTDAGTAHGNFIVRENHILTHFGFTGEDDFLCVVDRGSGKVLKKEKIATAANCLIEEDDGTITIPAYTGVYQYKFAEKLGQSSSSGQKDEG